jgi:hypothetical protein
MRISTQEIENTLLAGERLEWEDTKTTAKRTIQLSLARQRRLLSTLLASSSRSVRGLSPTFIQSLKNAYAGGEDPAVNASASTPLRPVPQKTWVLHKVEAYGFGGLTQSGGIPFEFEPGGVSTCLEGANGSGKSSLVAAITWALTGLRASDQFGPTASLTVPQPVLNASEQQIASWPPIAAYPAKPEDLSKPPKVGVRLTFRDEDSGQEAACVRKLSAGKEVVMIDPAFSDTAGVEAMVQVGVIMPSRLRHLRLGDKGTLSDAVQALTGLDRLSQLSDFVTDLCNGNMDFRRYARRENQSAHKESFNRSLESAEKQLPRETLDFDRLRNLQSAELLNDLRNAKTLLSNKAADHLKTLAEDLILPTTVQEQSRLSVAVARAEEEMIVGLLETSVARDLDHATEALESGALEPLRQQIQHSRDGIVEARLWRQRQKEDSRLRLKIVSARWHFEHHQEEPEIRTCPLCDQALTDRPELAAELAALRNKAEIAEQTFSQTCATFENALRTAWPSTPEFSPERWATLLPKATIVAELRNKFVEAERYSTLLPGVARRVETWLKAAETTWLELPISYDAGYDSTERALQTAVAGAERLLALTLWWKVNRPTFIKDWQRLIGSNNDEGSVQSCFSKCNEALALAKPFQEAAGFLESAFVAATTWQAIETEQQARDAIAEAIAPLKDLRLYVHHNTVLAINLLSAQIGDILRRIYLIDALRYENTTISKNVVTIHGSFNDRFKINATLVANTSWLRAVLWAFIFALRHETLMGLGRNPLPLVVLDDPQTTFDPQHRRKWAQLIASLQTLAPSDLNSAQFVITTYESGFVDNLNLEGFTGTLSTICGIHTATEGKAIILDGRRLDQTWRRADSEKTAEAAQVYIGQVRIEVETRLRLMLRGEGADVAHLIWSLLRERIDSLHAHGVPPYDRPIIKKLLGQLSPSLKEVKLINWPHHFRDEDVGYAQAVEVERFWRKTLSPLLLQSFQTQRDYVAMHGESSFQLSPRDSTPLPPGHEDILRAVPFQVRGRAAAVTDGRVADGRLSLSPLELEEQVTVQLSSHALFRLCAHTLEPVASTGDVLIVSHAAPIHPKNLVVVSIDGVMRGRRFDLSEASPELAILTAQAVNPYEIRSPIAVTRTAIQPKKIVGVLYGAASLDSTISTNEVEALDGEATVRSILREVYGLYQVFGRSAEPFALDGQYLLVQKASIEPARLIKSDGSLVLAVDENGGHYFKRLRVPDAQIIVLESLDLSGRESAILLGREPGDRPALVEIVPVVGVLFELPGLPTA